MTVIGVTGPTGAGKTTVLSVLARKGYEVVDCDRLYYALLRTDAALRAALEDAFGPVFRPDGTLDRPRLAARVFSDSGELERLDAIVNPAVYAAVAQKIKKCLQIGLAIDAVNLVESGIGALCTLTVAVTAPPEVRRERIMVRDRLDAARAAARIAAQKPDSFYREHCGLVLENTGDSQEKFERQAEEAFTKLLREVKENNECTKC